MFFESAKRAKKQNQSRDQANQLNVFQRLKSALNEDIEFIPTIAAVMLTKT